MSVSLSFPDKLVFEKMLSLRDQSAHWSRNDRKL